MGKEQDPTVFRSTGKRNLRMTLAGTALACLFVSWWSVAGEPATATLPFTAGEVKSILSHGPWPMPSKRDPSNRVSGSDEAIELGTHLFFDARLSRTGKVSCGTCHVPDRNWTDNLARGAGIATTDRNTPTLMNVRLGRWFGWDGAADSLWFQSIRPILDPRELGADPRHVAELVRKDDQLACRYRRTFGAAPSATDDEAVLVDVGKALAAFQETLQSGRTPFDDFRDALARGDANAARRYPESAQRGLKIFIGKGGCNTCHTGPNFTNGEFHDTGLSHFVAKGRVDPGRHAGIRQVRASRYNLLGPYNDDATRSTATGTRHVALEHRNFGEFKVPTLRNMILTAPYGHDGQLGTIADAVRHYSELNLDRLHADGEQLLKPLKLSATEQSDLVVFLESLSTFTNPWRPEDTGTCR
jgi:cytochrome c peroxidase